MAKDLVCQAGGGDRQTYQYCPSLVPQVGRTKAQNWEAISQYYTMETWHALSDLRVLEASKLDLVLDVPRALGLRFPSETTFQVLATMHCLATHGPDRAKGLSMDAKLAFFSACEGYVQTQSREPCGTFTLHRHLARCLCRVSSRLP